MTEKEFEHWLNATLALWDAVVVAHNRYIAVVDGCLAQSVESARNDLDASLLKLNTFLAPRWRPKSRQHIPMYSPRPRRYARRA